MEVKSYSVEKWNDPTGIIEGDRYEFLLEVEVEEDDELYSEEGLSLKVILAIYGEDVRIVNYQFYEATSNKPLDFALEEDEEEEILSFCKDHIKE
ncbi:DUF6509 family protein [Bacillaceae bacterium S4-13-58]